MLSPMSREFRVSHVPAALSEKLSPISSIIDSFRGARVELDQFVGDLLSRLDRESERHAEERSQSAEERQALENQIQELQASLEASRQPCEADDDKAKELAQLRSKLSNRNRESAERVNTIRELKSERDALHELHDQMSAEVESLRRQLDRADNTEANEQIESLLREKQELQAELEAVRVRAIDLKERLRDSQRQAAEERSELATEFRQMRRLLERQPVQQITKREAAPMVAMQAAATPADTVLNNVMAQFELVQQDVQRRRTAG